MRHLRFEVQRRRFVVDRNKRPALTSPWKIGFLVSLLLVTVSIGAVYAVTRTFGITWTWLQLNDGAWAFDQTAFVRELSPLVVLVAAMSLVAYFAITGAVRRYRSYLDSGLDYKNLIRSIKKINDLDESRINSIKGYPELKKFLLRMKSRINDREKSLDEREAALITRDGQLTSSDNLKADVGVLLGAINRGPTEGFKKELALTSDEMKQVEQAIRELAQSGEWDSEPADGAATMSAVDVEQLSALRQELIASTDSLKATIYDISAEMVASQNGAREIELHLNRIKAACNNNAAGSAHAPADTGALVDSLDKASTALSSLGDETRGMAIKTALKASAGDGEMSEMVKLADNVREVAGRFSGIASRYQEVSGQLRSALQNQPVETAGNDLGEVLETMSGKITFWVERSVVLSDKLNEFEKQLAESVSSIESRLGGNRAEESYQELSIEDSGSQIMADPTETSETQEPEQSAEVDTTGLEQDSALFEEIGDKQDDDMFDKTQPMPAAKGTVPDGPRDEEEEAPAAPSPDQAGADSGEPIRADVGVSDDTVEKSAVDADEPAAPTEYVIEPETPDVDMSIDIESHRHEAPPVEEPVSAPEPAQAASQDLPDENGKIGETERVYDLYEIGAVDYEPGIHQNA
jgi:hypothetical protein